jgi:hypothetical protein
MTVRELANTIIGEIPRMPYPAAVDQVKRAWKEIRDMRLWSWLQGEGVIIVPDQVNAGTVSLTKLSAAATFDATAITALNTSNTLYLTTAPVAGRQIKLDNHVYTLLTYDTGTGAATLDHAYLGVTNATATYSVLQAYVKSPGGLDHRLFENVRDADNGYSIGLVGTQAELNSRDHQRSSAGDPYHLVYHHTGTDGIPRYELWPHPTAHRGYVAVYFKRGVVDHASVTFPAATFTFPLTLAEDVIQELALYHACLWAEKNKGQFPELGAANWRYVAGEHKRQYQDALVQAKKADTEIAVTTWIPAPGGFNSPVDAAFAQSHDVDWL